MLSLSNIFPPPEQLIQLEPEEVGMFVLQCLCLAGKEDPGLLHWFNFTNQGRLHSYVQNRAPLREVAKVITEGWVWLEREMMIAPSPGSDSSGRWVFVTRRGYRANAEDNLTAYKSAWKLPEAVLDHVLARKVKPLFIRGDHELAVFEAFRTVEIRVREAAILPQELVGTQLMRQAFHVNEGPLTDVSKPVAEREAMGHLFAGAIGLYKNPSSHRTVNFNDADEAAELIFMANHLLRVVGKLKGAMPASEETR